MIKELIFSILQSFLISGGIGTILGVVSQASQGKIDRNSIFCQTRFFLGILVGITILAVLWYGSGYQNSMTPDEMGLRIICLLSGAVGFVAITLISIIMEVVPILYSQPRTTHFFITGLTVSVAINGLAIILLDIRQIPYLTDMPIKQQT